MAGRVAAGLGIALLALAGCTSSGGGGPSSPAPPSHSEPSGPVPVPPPSTVPASVPNKPGVISTGLVAITTCRPTPTGWRASGTAGTATGHAAHYTVTVFFTTAEATVEAYGATGVDVPAGQSRRWSVTARFRGVAGTRCVLRGAG